MWWLNIIFHILVIVCVITSMQLKQRTMINKTLIENGIMPKYDTKKLSKWCNINFAFVICVFIGALINVVIQLLWVGE